MRVPVGDLLHPFHPPMSEVVELVSGNATWRVLERCARAWGGHVYVVQRMFLPPRFSEEIAVSRSSRRAAEVAFQRSRMSEERYTVSSFGGSRDEPAADVVSMVSVDLGGDST
jgi:hypothetical protein